MTIVDTARRSVVTGLGIVAPLGIGVRDSWDAATRGASGLVALDEWGPGDPGVRVVGSVPEFDETRFVENRLRVQTDRWTWLGLAATELALADAALDPADEPPESMSVVTASAAGGNAFGQREIAALWRDGPHAVSAYQSIGWFYAASSGQISIKHQFKGACGVIVADGAGGIDALARTGSLIRRGTEAVVVGATEAPLSPYALTCQARHGLFADDADVARAYRPFAPDATGFVPGEGGAMLVVEEAERARDRSAATVYAEVAGTASTHDGRDQTGSTQLERAIRQALARADRVPADVDVVFADGAAVRDLDRREAAAIVAVFGPGAVPVTVPKTMTGRLGSGGAVLDVALACLTLRTGVVPPSINVDPDAGGHELDLVAEPRAGRFRTAVVIARGVGGFNSVAVLSAPS